MKLHLILFAGRIVQRWRNRLEHVTASLNAAYDKEKGYTPVDLWERGKHLA